MPVHIKQLTGPMVVSEGPHWDIAQQALFFISFSPAKLHKYVPSSGKYTSVYIDDGDISFMIPVKGVPNQFAAAIKRKFVILEWDGGDNTPVKVVKQFGEVAQDQPTTRINDGKADPRGRLYAGTMGQATTPGEWERYKGYFYKVDRGHITKLEDKISLSNGIAFDEARKAFYYIDTLEKNIRRYDYDVETGNISNLKYIFDFEAKGVNGVPDGCTIDTDGNLWVAVFFGSCVININPSTGELLRKIDMPVNQITSVAFGGANLDELFVTSASIRIDSEEQPPAGAVFHVTGVGATGLPAYEYKL